MNFGVGWGSKLTVLLGCHCTIWFSFYFKALADKLNLGQENFINFALFEIQEDGFGKSVVKF